MERKHLALLGLALVVTLSAFLRFHNLEANPGWDGDEGYNINIAWNLSQGRFQMFAVDYAFVQHPPLFYTALVPVFGALGANILALRLLAAFYGVLTTTALFFVAKDIAGAKIALLSSALFAVYPVAVVYNRLGYSYNQLMFFAIVCFYFSWRFIVNGNRKSRWLSAGGAGLAAGLGSVTDQEGAFLIVFVLLLVALVERRHLALAGVSSLVLPLVYIGLMLATVPAEFIYDLQHNFGRVSSRGPIIEGIMLAFGYDQFLQFSYWLPLGIVGLFLLRERRAKLVTVCFFLLMLLFILKIRNPNPFFRTAVPVLPFIALGMGLFLDAAVTHLFKWSDEVWRETLGERWSRLRPVATALVTFVLVFLPIATMSAVNIVGVQTKLQSGIDGVLANSPTDATEMASFINERARDNDVVVASPHVSWLLAARTTDLLQAVAAEGKKTAFYPADLPEHRFVFDPRAASARFIVVDDFSRLWARDMPGERAILDAVTASWRKVYEVGEYHIYENPDSMR